MTEIEHNGVVAVEAAETSKDDRQLLADITAGLEGVTPGPWEEHAGLIRAIDGDEAIPICDMRTPWKKHSRTKTVVRQECHNSRHIARCDPETMQAIDREFTALTLELSAANHRIAELEAERQWQPIETAPVSNGSQKFLGFVAGHGPTVAVSFKSGIAFSAQGVRLPSMTHWMPLPASPHEGTQS